MDKFLYLGIQVLLCLIICDKTFALYCYQCNSNDDAYCSELFSQEGIDIQPTLCEGIYEVKYCIKTTGMYEGTIGTQRFCSSRHHGTYCEYVRRPGDDRDYRSCVYTCSSDGCNGTSTISKSIYLILISALSCLLFLVIS